MLKVGSLLAVSAAALNPFTDSAKFERWSHFKDYGVPAVLGKDALNSAAIADGSCRFLQAFDGFDFWHYPSRVQRVLLALKNAPPTSNPSNFVLSTQSALEDACSNKQSDKAVQQEYEIESLRSSVQNWYHALTAPASDASWKGQFDPAYQPQQVTLTAGFMCIAACDLNNGEISKRSMEVLAMESSTLRKAVNSTFPWVPGNTLFSSAESAEDLASLLMPMLKTPCGCTTKAAGALALADELSKFCPESLEATYADMHDGDKKDISISDSSISIRPSGNNQTWIVKSEVDRKSCSASINFNVPGKPGPPPVNLQANLWYSVSSKGKKTVFEFTDPSGTLAANHFPLNHWVEEVKKEEAMSMPCPDKLHAVYADMHDGDKKEVIISGTSLTIKPSGNNQTWLVKSEVDPKTCSASIDFNVPGKPGPPPVNLQATLAYIISPKTKKTEFEFTDPSGTLAAPAEPLNQWVEISRVAEKKIESDFLIIL